MKICDVCHQTVEQLQGGPKGMETIDCCSSCLLDLHHRIQALNQKLEQQRVQMWGVMLNDWRQARTPEQPAKETELG